MIEVAMTDELNEQLSALMDGEFLPEEMEAVLQAFKTEEPIRTQWANYHLIHDSLQGHLPVTCLPSVADQVSRALENEPPLLVARRPVLAATQRLRYRWTYAAGLALAASLSAITVLGIQAFTQAFTSESVRPESWIAATPPFVFSDSGIVPVVESDVYRGARLGLEVESFDEELIERVNNRARLEPEVERRLSSYLVNHTEYVDMPDMIRYGRIVSYETSR